MGAIIPLCPCGAGTAEVIVSVPSCLNEAAHTLLICQACATCLACRFCRDQRVVTPGKYAYPNLEGQCPWCYRRLYGTP